MKKIFTIIPILLTTLVFSDAMARDYGPEWNKVTFPNSNYVEYQRNVQISATHAGIGNVTNYPVDLEHHSLNIFELDDNLGVNIHIRQYGEFSMAKDLQGNPESFTVALGAVRYFDLNGDGYIDARYDGHKELSEIFIEGKYLPVKSSKEGVKSSTRTSLDGKTVYVFSGGKWLTGH
jgi:hypothetical protein